MASDWQLRVGGHSRSLTWEELNEFKQTGELPDVGGALPVLDPRPLSSYRGPLPLQRNTARYERIWSGTHGGRHRLGWPSRPDFSRPRPRLRLIAGGKTHHEQTDGSIFGSRKTA
jgi:hypothetical protein